MAQSTSTNNFILIASCLLSHKYGEMTGYDVTEYRLDDCIWPLYKYTRNRRIIRENDNLLIYIAGRSQYGRCFVAKATVAEVLNFNPRQHRSYYEPSYIVPEKMIKLKDIEWFSKPVDIIGLLDQLAIIPSNKKKWGCIMHGGCRKLSNKDYNLILESAIE